MYLWQQRSPALLGAWPERMGFYRPNQAMNTVYSGYAISGLGAPPVLSIASMKAVRPLSGLAHWKNVQQSHTGPGMGDDSTAVDPKLLLGGIGLLAAGMFLLGGKHGPRLRKRKAARLRARLKELEA